MNSYQDLYTLKSAIVQGKITAVQIKEALGLARDKNLSLNQILREKGLLTEEEWHLCRDHSLQLSKFSPNSQYYQWENREVLKRLQKVIDPSKAAKLLTYFKEARQEGKGFLSLLLKKDLLSQKDLRKLLGVRFSPVIQCSSCQVQLPLEHHYPWRKYLCPLCDRNMTVKTNGPSPSGASNRGKPVHSDQKNHPANKTTKKWDKYQILDKIGEGGMGKVYKAYDPGLDRVVALKVISSREISPEQWKRFQREMKLSARLNHPGIIPLYNWGKFEDKPYFTLGFIEGTDLRDYVGKGGSLTITTALDLGQKLAETLSYAHSQGVIHRDIKPSNIMIDTEGKPYLMDFGLATEIQEKNTRLTKTGAIVGSPEFMAPEQALGSSKIGKRADIYALGGVLYFMLTGRPPFQGRDILHLLHKVVEEEPTPVNTLRLTVSKDLNTVVHTCLRKNPLHRYPQADLLAQDLKNIQGKEPIWARPPLAREKFFRWLKKHALILSGGIMAGIIVILLIYIASLTPPEKSPVSHQSPSSTTPPKKPKSLKGKGDNLPPKKRGKEILQQGIELYSKGKYRQAQEKFLKAREESPHLAEVYHWIGTYYSSIAKNDSKAMKAFNRAIELDRKLARAYSKRAVIWAKRKKWTRALKDLNQAIKFNPYLSNAYKNRGEIHRIQANFSHFNRKEKLEMAWRDWKKALELGHPSFSHIQSLGVLELKRKNFSQALKIYRSLLKHIPPTHEAKKKGLIHFRLAQIYWSLKKYKLGRTYLQEALQRRPRTPIYRYYRGLFRTEMKKYHLALEDFNYCQQKNYSPPLMYFFKGYSYFQMGKWDRARDNLKKYLRVDPAGKHKDQAKQLLQSIPRDN